MSLFGRSKCKPTATVSSPRWRIYVISNQSHQAHYYIRAHIVPDGSHATKENAIAEMTARLPRLAKGEALLLWDDECEEWVDWEATA